MRIENILEKNKTEIKEGGSASLENVISTRLEKGGKEKQERTGTNPNRAHPHLQLNTQKQNGEKN